MLISRYFSKRHELAERKRMPPSLIIPSVIISILASPAFAAAQAPLPSLFGFTIGQKLSDRSGLLSVAEDETYFNFTRRESQNKEYSHQSVGISKLTGTIVLIEGMTVHEDVGSCHRQEYEIITQLRERYPSLHDKIDEVNGTVHHLLSYERPNCSFDERAAGMELHLPCSSSYHLYCQAASNWLFLTAQDTEYSKLARDEAVRFIRMSPRRNQLE